MYSILIVSNVPFWGGGESFVVGTLSRLSEYYDVYYIVRNKQLYDNLPENKKTLLLSDSLYLQYKALKKYAEQINPNLILFNGGSLFYFLPLIKWKKVLYRHSTNLSAPKHLRWLYSVVMNIVYSFADLTIHVSKYSQQQQYLNKKNSLCIHNGINIPVAIPKKVFCRPIKVLYCGRLEESKGIIQVIEAFKSIDSSVAELVVLGTGPLETWARQNATLNIRVEGFRSDVDIYYKQVDAMILMSQYENCPISVLEAMSNSLPVITTGAGGISEMISDGIEGLVIELSPKCIVKAVQKLAFDSRLCVDMGNRAYDCCKKHFDINNKVEEIHIALDKLLNS